MHLETASDFQMLEQEFYSSYNDWPAAGNCSLDRSRRPIAGQMQPVQSDHLRTQRPAPAMSGYDHGKNGPQPLAITIGSKAVLGDCTIANLFHPSFCASLAKVGLPVPSP